MTPPVLDSIGDVRRVGSEETGDAPVDGPGEPPSDGLPTTSDVTIRVLESRDLRVPATLGTARGLQVGREGVLRFLPAPDETGDLPRAVESVRCIGVKPGTTVVTFFGENGESESVTVTVEMTQDYLETVLRTRFPAANLRLEFLASDLLVVDGEVASVAEIEPILSLLRRFVKGGKDNVVNAIRVTGVMQVQLEVVFARVDRTELRALGVNILSADTPWYFGSQIGGLIGPPGVKLPSGAPNRFPLVGAFDPDMIPAGDDLSAVLTPASSLFFGITKYSGEVFGYLEALKEQGIVKVLATPTLVTLSGRPAEFLAGGQQPIPVVNGVGGNATVTAQLKPFGTRLVFLPVVLGDNRIRMELVPSVSRVSNQQVTVVNQVAVPTFIEQKLHATVEMEAGETLILGGLIETEKTSQVSKVPLLGEMPLLGTLFRRVRDLNRETELLVIVTPRLVTPLPQKPCAYPGSETRSPTDHELFLDGVPEVSVCAPPNAGRSVERGSLLQRHRMQPLEFRSDLQPAAIDAFPPSPLPPDAAQSSPGEPRPVPPYLPPARELPEQPATVPLGNSSRPGRSILFPRRNVATKPEVAPALPARSSPNGRPTSFSPAEAASQPPGVYRLFAR